MENPINKVKCETECQKKILQYTWVLKLLALIYKEPIKN